MMTDFNTVADNLVEQWLKDLGTMGIEWDDIASLKLRISGEMEEATRDHVIGDDLYEDLLLICAMGSLEIHERCLKALQKTS